MKKNKKSEFIKQFQLPVVESDIEWLYKKSMAISGRDHVLSRDDRFCIQRETYKKSTSYFIDEVPNEFSTIDELLYALNLKIEADKAGMKVEFYGAIINSKQD